MTNDTDLVWQPNTEPDLAGYEVVWRETTRRMSKDNLQFGVRAVDHDGNKSPVSFPLPG